MINLKNLDKFLNSTSLTASIFLVSGGYKTYKDYRAANLKYKKKFLIKDCVVLSGAAAGMLVNRAIGKKIVKNSFYRKTIDDISKKITKTRVEAPIKYTSSIIGELLAGVSATAFGILGALGADFLLSQTKFKQPEKSKLNPKKDKLEKYFENNMHKYADNDTVNVFYTSMTEMPQMKFLTSAMLGADAIDIAKDLEFDKRLEHTTKYLVNDTLFPLLFLSISSALTKKMKPLFRIPVIFASLIGGTLAINKIADLKMIKSESRD